MNMNEMYPSKYLCHEDLNGQDYTVTITAVHMEDVGNGADKQKPVCYFTGHTKGCITNVTNGRIIEALYGSDSDLWIGKAITLYTGDTRRPDGTPCKGIMVRQVAPAPAFAPTAAPFSPTF